MIFVDSAVGSKDLLVPLRAAGLDAQLAKLDYADVEFVGRGEKGTPVMVGVEVKRMSELTGDFERLAGHQIPKMTTHYEYRWLVYEGDWIVDASSGTLLSRKGRSMVPLRGRADAATLRQRLLTLEMRGGIHRERTASRKDTVIFLCDLFHWWTDRNFDEHKSHIVNYQPSGIVPMTPSQQAFAALPGLSTVRARSVDAAFGGSLARACAASEAVWADIVTVSEDGKVRRLGEKLAARIVQFLHGN